MRGMATLAAALLLGLGTAAAQDRSGDDPPAKKPQASEGSWLTRWWPFGRKPEPKKAAPAPRRPSAVETARAVRVREEAALLRRLAVCDRLREIAAQSQKPDQGLWRKAEELETLARETYTLRTSHLPSSGAVGGPDEGTLARRLGPGANGLDASALSAGGRGAADSNPTAERRDR